MSHWKTNHTRTVMPWTWHLKSDLSRCWGMLFTTQDCGQNKPCNKSLWAVLHRISSLLHFNKAMENRLRQETAYRRHLKLEDHRKVFRTGRGQRNKETTVSLWKPLWSPSLSLPLSLTFPLLTYLLPYHHRFILRAHYWKSKIASSWKNRRYPRWQWKDIARIWVWQ